MMSTSSIYQITTTKTTCQSNVQFWYSFKSSAQLSLNKSTTEAPSHYYSALQTILHNTYNSHTSLQYFDRNDTSSNDNQNQPVEDKLTHLLFPIELCDGTHSWVHHGTAFVGYTNTQCYLYSYTRQMLCFKSKLICNINIYLYIYIYQKLCPIHSNSTLNAKLLCISNTHLLTCTLTNTNA